METKFVSEGPVPYTLKDLGRLSVAWRKETVGERALDSNFKIIFTPSKHEDGSFIEIKNKIDLSLFQN